MIGVVVREHALPKPADTINETDKTSLAMRLNHRANRFVVCLVKLPPVVSVCTLRADSAKGIIISLLRVQESFDQTVDRKRRDRKHADESEGEENAQ